MPLLALFDVDGTLFLTDDEVSTKAMLGSLHEVYGVELPEDAIAHVDHRGQTATRIARELLRAGGLDDEAIEERLDHWCRRFADVYLELLRGADTSFWESRPGARDGLARLEGAGVRLALLTGNPEPVARARLERLGLAGFFPPGSGAFGCDAEERRELIKLARKRAREEWPPAEIVAIGDTPRDVTSAHEAGIRSIVIRSARAEPDEAFDDADAVVEDMESLTSALLALSREAQAP